MEISTQQFDISLVLLLHILTKSTAGLQIRVHIGKLFSLFLIQNICYGYLKELSHRDGAFEHQKHMFKLMGKQIILNKKS